MAKKKGDELATLEPPKLTMIARRNLAWDTLAEVCGVAANSPRQGDIAVALNGRKSSARQPGIRRLFWQEVVAEAERLGTPPPVASESYEQGLALAIKQRAALYRRAMPGAMLTPTALAKWWTDVPLQQTGLLTAEDIAAEAIEERRRGR